MAYMYGLIVFVVFLFLLIVFFFTFPVLLNEGRLALILAR